MEMAISGQGVSYCCPHAMAFPYCPGVQMISYMKSLLRLVKEFPASIRHLCTTIPWTIWPTLAVLWGACSMFAASEEGSWTSPSQPLPWVVDLDDYVSVAEGD